MSIWIMFWRVLAIIFFLVGIITAGLEQTILGFTPEIWFLLMIGAILCAICHVLIEKKE